MLNPPSLINVGSDVRIKAEESLFSESEIFMKDLYSGFQIYLNLKTGPPATRPLMKPGLPYTLTGMVPISDRLPSHFDTARGGIESKATDRVDGVNDGTM